MKSFNIRVYGLLINDNREILISDERRFEHSFTKFPGGGLEFGEGLADGLKREFLEELNTDVEVGSLFYVNEFYQASAYNKNHQLLSFYYFVHGETWEKIEIGSKAIPLENDGEQQRWIPLAELSSELMTFPIDKIVAQKLADSALLQQ